MAAIRSLNIAAGTAAPNATTTIYTVPTGYVLLLKTALFTMPIGVSVDLRWNVAQGPNYVWVEYTTLASGGTHSWAGWIVINSGGVISLSTTAQAYNYWFSGAQLPDAG